jgi:hypothetical protein
MPIEVIAKIEPKNSAFTVIVEAEHAGVNTASFIGNFSATENTVQKALNVIDGFTIHPAVTVSAPISLSVQALSLVNDAAGTITEIDTGTLANAATSIPSSQTVFNAIGSFGGGDVSGLQVTINSATSLFVWGGKIRINNAIYQADSQITYNTASLAADTLYHFYVNAPLSGSILSATELNLSTAGFEVGSTPPLPPYDHAKGARYHSTDGTKRWLANVHTA